LEEPIIAKKRRGMVGLEFNKKHAHLFEVKEVVYHELVYLNTVVNHDFYFEGFEMLERECVMRKTRSLVQPQLAP
jgi:hypothetical protein